MLSPIQSILKFCFQVKSNWARLNQNRFLRSDLLLDMGKLVRTARAWVPLDKPLPCHMCYRSSGQSKVCGQAQTPRVERQPHHLMGAWCLNGVDTGGEDLWLHLQSTTAEQTSTHGPQREFMIYHSFYSGYSLHVKYRYFITTHGERMYTFMQLLYMKNYVSLYWT